MTAKELLKVANFKRFVFYGAKQFNKDIEYKNAIYSFSRIECISKPYPNGSGHFIFKGKTLEGAKKAAQKYCEKYTQFYSKNGWTMEVGKVLYECDYYGKEIKARWI